MNLADSYFITQYYHKRYNPAQARVNNANCGPTSLAMALRAFGTEPAGLDAPDESVELVRVVRKAMTGRLDEQTWTYPVQVRDGARKLGLNSRLVFSIDDIKAAGVNVLFAEKFFAGKLAETIQNETGVQMFSFSHISDGEYSPTLFEEEMRYNLDQLEMAIASTAP